MKKQVRVYIYSIIIVVRKQLALVKHYDIITKSLTKEQERIIHVSEMNYNLIQ